MFCAAVQLKKVIVQSNVAAVQSKKVTGSAGLQIRLNRGEFWEIVWEF